MTKEESEAEVARLRPLTTGIVSSEVVPRTTVERGVDSAE